MLWRRRLLERSLGAPNSIVLGRFKWRVVKMAGHFTYVDRNGNPLSASDISWIKKCVKLMSPSGAIRWEAIAARPERSAVLLSTRESVQAACDAYARG